MASFWIYLNVGIMVALVALGAAAIGALSGNRTEWILTDKPHSSEQDPESLEGSEDTEMRVQGYEECINSLPDKKLVAEGVTKTVPFVVQLGWHAYQLKTGDMSDVEVRILDKSRKPLSGVTYDFMYKGAIDVEHIQDRYVADFSVIEADRFPLKIRHPCGMHFGVFIDKVGQQSFLRTDEIEKYGNVSPVGLLFREMSDMTGNGGMVVYNDANTDP
ncbi:MAG: hypothetical protein ACRD38_04990 [Nitrososphaerales archaeon]